MDRRSLAALGFVAILLPFCWCFGEALFTSRALAHRDASRFYHPLFAWTTSEWKAGRVPLWNSQENCGTSVVGDTTSSVWYPGKLLFFLPLEFGRNYKLYVTLHVLLAAAFTLLLARRWRASLPAATLAALAYAFSGYVLFQYSNVVFLVGAAWLPAALLAVDRMLRGRRPLAALWLGMTLALMTLGGDPQTAYHAGLLAALYAVLLGWRRVRRYGWRRPERFQAAAREQPAEGAPPRTTAARRRLTLLTLAAVTGAVLAAVQILPSMQWGARSERAAFYEPRSLYQVPAVLVSGAAEAAQGGGEATGAARVRKGLLGSPTPDTHHRNLYRYSVAPWQLVQMLVPNVAGKPFPVNRRVRWTSEEGVNWVPSLYLGILPLGLGLSVWSLRRGSPRARWLSWIVLLAALGSFGWYGPGWFLRAVMGGAGENGAAGAWIGEPVGGLYWLMVVILPGYDQFRYPAKLFLLVTLGLSLLAAQGWDRARLGSRRPAGLFAVWGVVLGVVLLVALGASGWLKSWLGALPPDPLFGPVVVPATMRVLYLALLHAAVVCGACWWLTRRLARSGPTPPFWPQAALLMLTSVELAIAQGWMVTTAPQDIWRQRPWAAREIAADAEVRQLDIASLRVLRSQSPRFQPRQWFETASPQREAEGLRWHRETLRPRTHLTTEISLLEVNTSVTPDDFQAVLGIARQFGPPRPGGISQPHPHLLDALGVGYVVQSDSPALAAQEQSLGRSKLSSLPEQNAALWSNPRAFPRAWIVHQVEWLPEVGTRDAALTDALTAHVFFPRGGVRDLRTSAAVEVDEPPDPRAMRPSADPPPTDFCRVERYESQRVEIRADLASSGLVVLRDYFDPDWTAEVTDAASGTPVPAPVLRTNRILRGTFLPAGRYRIVYRYEPRWFWFGALLSATGWVACLVLLGARSVRRRATAAKEAAKTGKPGPVA